MMNSERNSGEWEANFRFVLYSMLTSLIIDGLILAVVLFLLNVFNVDRIFVYVSLSVFLIGYVLELVFSRNYFKYAYIKEVSKLKVFEFNRGRFYKRKTYIPFDKIYGISEKTNIFQALFKIYDLEIQTAAKQYVFHGMTKPDLEMIINNYYLSENKP